MALFLVLVLKGFDSKITVIGIIQSPSKTVMGHIWNKNPECDPFLHVSRSYPKDAYITFEKMKVNPVDVKTFIRGYSWPTQELLMFHRPEESCRICEGSLYYYFNEINKQIIKKCATCSVAFSLNGEIIEPNKFSSNLRPASKK